jgi:hypothetical protein
MLKSFLLSNRPYALFDANNAEHRKLYATFLKTKTWSTCPYKFVLEEPFTDLPSSINYKLVNHYLGKEFKGKKPTVVKTQRQKK